MLPSVSFILQSLSTPFMWAQTPLLLGLDPHLTEGSRTAGQDSGPGGLEN